MYPDERVSTFISQNFVPVKIHIKEQPGVFQRFGAQWTPTLMIFDPSGKERYRFEGYLPPDDFLAQLEFGLARSTFAAEKWGEAEKEFLAVAEAHPKSEAAPEAVYWAGVSRYKASHDGAALADAARQLASRYPESAWTKKSSVWVA